MPRYIAVSVDKPRHRRIENAQTHQHVVENAVALQDVHPRIDADQERGPERHDDQHHRERLEAPRQSRHAVSDRIADDEQQRGRDRGDGEAAQIGAPVKIVGDEQPKIVERQRPERLDESVPTGGNSQTPADKAAATVRLATG